MAAFVRSLSVGIAHLQRGPGHTLDSCNVNAPPWTSTPRSSKLQISYLVIDRKHLITFRAEVDTFFQGSPERSRL